MRCKRCRYCEQNEWHSHIFTCSITLPFNYRKTNHDSLSELFVEDGCSLFEDSLLKVVQ